MLKSKYFAVMVTWLVIAAFFVLLSWVPEAKREIQNTAGMITGMMICIVLRAFYERGLEEKVKDQEYYVERLKSSLKYWEDAYFKIRDKCVKVIVEKKDSGVYRIRKDKEHGKESRRAKK